MLLAELLDSLSPAHNIAARKHAIHELRRHSRVAANRSALGGLPKAVQLIVELLRRDEPELCEDAAGTLCNLCCSNDVNKVRIGGSWGSKQSVNHWQAHLTAVQSQTLPGPATHASNPASNIQLPCEADAVVRPQ